ncbi:hypothetical protein DFH09DRAFT_1277077 [Mycena vulgaris]|nr:hypothetical protein DFH09DRAFT_1277077 [Mycena vulgaris]
MCLSNSAEIQGNAVESPPAGRRPCRLGKVGTKCEVSIARPRHTRTSTLPRVHQLPVRAEERCRWSDTTQCMIMKTTPGPHPHSARARTQTKQAARRTQPTRTWHSSRPHRGGYDKPAHNDEGKDDSPPIPPPILSFSPTSPFSSILFSPHPPFPLRPNRMRDGVAPAEAQPALRAHPIGKETRGPRRIVLFLSVSLPASRFLSHSHSRSYACVGVNDRLSRPGLSPREEQTRLVLGIPLPLIANADADADVRGMALKPDYREGEAPPSAYLRIPPPPLVTDADVRGCGAGGLRGGRRHASRSSIRVRGAQKWGEAHIGDGVDGVAASSTRAWIFLSLEADDLPSSWRRRRGERGGGTGGGSGGGRERGRGGSFGVAEVAVEPVVDVEELEEYLEVGDRRGGRRPYCTLVLVLLVPILVLVESVGLETGVACTRYRIRRALDRDQPQRRRLVCAQNRIETVMVWAKAIPRSVGRAAGGSMRFRVDIDAITPSPTLTSKAPQDRYRAVEGMEPRRGQRYDPQRDYLQSASRDDRSSRTEIGAAKSSIEREWGGAYGSNHALHKLFAMFLRVWSRVPPILRGEHSANYHFMAEAKLKLGLELGAGE